MVKKLSISDEISSSINALDEPVESGLFDFFKKGKLQCRIIYEDMSYMDFNIKFSSSYVIEIKKRSYLVVPKCIVRGKQNFIVWYFNNPMPINFEYEQSQLTALKLLEADKKKKLDDDEKSILAKTTIDSEGLHSIFNTKLLQGLYEKGGMTGKAMLMYAVGGLVIILVLLQITGTVDVIGELNKIIKGT